MTGDTVEGSVLDHIPGSLFRHSAWAKWKTIQGWTSFPIADDVFPGINGGELGLSLLTRSLGPLGSMVYAPGAPPPAYLRDAGDAVLEGDYGALLEGFSLRIQPFLPANCVFLRWDLVLPGWTDERGHPLDFRLQELRMNASTRHRRFRKTTSENTCLDTIVVDLSGGGEDVWSRMDYRTRYSVRLAQRRGTTVARIGEAGLAQFHELHRRTASRKGLRVYPESCFQQLFTAARGTSLKLDLYLASSSGAPVSSAIIAREGKDAWYLFAASSVEHKRAAGPSAILHRALMDCAAEGCHRMDLLGVGPPHAMDHPFAGLTLFKTGFGGVRKNRVGAWDYVLNPDAYARYAQAETFTAD